VPRAGPSGLLRRAAADLLYSRLGTSLYWSLWGGRFRAAPLKTLLILSHMRSGSSLLVHLLNTHPKVFGYGETFLTYERPSDLRRLPMKMLLRTRRALRQQEYVVDKLLHPRLLAGVGVLSDPEVRCIFLLRDPDSALRSLIRAPSLPGWWQSPGWSLDGVDQKVVVDYYCRRLNELACYARSMRDPSRSLVVTYDEVVSQTSAVFSALEHLLDLEGGFAESYDLLDSTGQPGAGDPSENIRKGFIDRGIRREPVDVRGDLLERSHAAYTACLAALHERCTVIVSGSARRAQDPTGAPTR
jgi:hypothetical protein